ncbi:hypothetical protein NPX13_g11219 [Xylaria arbuscula]|uniref:HTH CENPB-type domain-containing protein n=1 Tax=Xylaria arbuscula TaxID=114810 RepID=A0A9W8N370_9PEZI|nr:hypothetical protein NPX13_g11219 [Xylaria arbuscula]
MARYTEEDVDSAIAAVRAGRSIRKAALEWGVPRATLQERISGRSAGKEGFSHLQKVDPVTEERLAQWVLLQSDLGLPPTHAELREFASRVLKAQGLDVSLGKHWVSRFLTRNPSIQVHRSRSIDSRRLNGATTDIIRRWFQRLAIPAVKTIKPKNRHNTDEIGIMEGMGKNGLVLGRAQKAVIQRKTPGGRTWSSIIECISAVGTFLPPLVIFKGSSLQQQWYPLDLKPFIGWKWDYQKKGWTDDSIGLEWVQKVFIPLTRPDDPSEARLLILDGHGSHITVDFMWECYQNNIQLLYLPPHASHVLQPLDVAVFSPLKTAYRKYLGYATYLHDSSVAGKRNFLECYRRARLDAFTLSNILSGWRATGLWPVSVRHPLLSPLLLKKPLQKAPMNLKDVPTNSQVNNLLESTDLEAEKVVWSTPRHSQDLRRQLDIYTTTTKGSTTQRLLFSKVKKAFVEKDTQLAFERRENEAWKAKFEAAIPRKRKKVELSPQSKFASIEDIRRGQIAAGDVVDASSDSIGSDLTSEAEDCIVVGADDSESDDEDGA